jgi:methylene-tetrahydromethanopterin dehydrogenase
MHMFTPMAHTSPFDINMAIDAGYDMAFPHQNMQLAEVSGMTQDAIFSRGPKGVKKTGVFIEISVFADPSGAFTTAASLVACVGHELKNKTQHGFKGTKAIVFGGTGPVGFTTAIIAAQQGADTTIVDHFSLDTALEFAAEAKRRYNVDLTATTAASDADKARLITNADIIFCTAKAGIQVLNASVLSDAKKLKVAGDVNAVPPLGIEGIKVMDSGALLTHAINSKGAVAIGALAIGNVKYNLQHELLRQTLETKTPVYIDFRHAFEGAKKLV